MQAYPQMTPSYQQSFVNQVSEENAFKSSRFKVFAFPVVDQPEHGADAEQHDEHAATAWNAIPVYEPTGEN